MKIKEPYGQIRRRGKFCDFLQPRLSAALLQRQRRGYSAYAAYGRFKFFAPTALKIFAIAIVGEQQFVVLAAAQSFLQRSFATSARAPRNGRLAYFGARSGRNYIFNVRRKSVANIRARPTFPSSDKNKPSASLGSKLNGIHFQRKARALRLHRWRRRFSRRFLALVFPERRL